MRPEAPPPLGRGMFVFFRFRAQTNMFESETNPNEDRGAQNEHVRKCLTRTIVRQHTEATVYLPVVRTGPASAGPFFVLDICRDRAYIGHIT